MKKKVNAKVLSQKELTNGIFDMWIATDLACEAGPGQFIGVYTSDASKILPRPISICEVDKDNKALRIVYRVTKAGSGTDNISEFTKDDDINILGILGNGYDLCVADDKEVTLMGGGIGIPPMLELAKALKKKANAKCVNIILGYRDSNLFLKEDFDAILSDDIKLYIATEDGSVGTKGNVLNVMKELHADGMYDGVIMACGPMPMLRAIAAYADETSSKAYISLEERMACGVGACLGCITKTKDIDSHSKVHNARICTDGPVFDADELDLSK